MSAETLKHASAIYLLIYKEQVFIDFLLAAF